MSGFTRDTKYYGDQLVYEALGSKWGRYHSTHCGCGRDWVSAHAESAGFTVVRSGRGFVALTGPGLTKGVDESALTVDALWEAVTGKPGKGRTEQIRIVDRSEKTEDKRKAANDRVYGARRERAAKPRAESAADKQIRYLITLASKVRRDRFDAEFNKAVMDTGVAPRGPDETTQAAVRRLTKAAAHKLITALAGSEHSSEGPRAEPALCYQQRKMKGFW
ncbi:hypothetical protein [Streptomyces sp. 3N207]|uniref:hypothetical protein n=1 Tax=Streptomyces sp. 3N207 TaxID=3457417 RepID=UPI003FD1E451